MAYTAGDTILDDEYNTFVNSGSSPFGLNHFAATGSAQYGLGQSAVATVSAGDTINAPAPISGGRYLRVPTTRESHSGGSAVGIRAQTKLATTAALTLHGE